MRTESYKFYIKRNILPSLELKNEYMYTHKHNVFFVAILEKYIYIEIAQKYQRSSKKYILIREYIF